MHNFGKRAGLRPVFLFLALGLSLWAGPALAQETTDASTTENDLERPPPLDPDPGRPPGRITLLAEDRRLRAKTGCGRPALH